MNPSRVDSLERPAGAGRAPFLLFFAVLVLVAVVLVVGLSRIDWVLVLLVPVLLLTAYFVAGVLRVLVGNRGAGAGSVVGDENRGGERREREGERGESEEE